MDYERFPMLKLAFDCGRIGGTAPTVYNAAKEVAVESFLHREIEFLDIEEIVTQTVERHETVPSPDLACIEEADRWARRTAKERIHKVL